jgi:hypothetical protein
MHVLCWHMNVHIAERIQVCFEVVSTEKKISYVQPFRTRLCNHFLQLLIYLVINPSASECTRVLNAAWRRRDSSVETKSEKVKRLR